MEDGRIEILHELYLTFRIPDARRDDEHPDLFSAVMESQTAGEHAVTDDVLEDIGLIRAGHHNTACNKIGPRLDIPFFVWKMTVALPVVPDDECIRTISSRGTRSPDQSRSSYEGRSLS